MVAILAFASLEFLTLSVCLSHSCRHIPANCTTRTKNYNQTVYNCKLPLVHTLLPRLSVHPEKSDLPISVSPRGVLLLWCGESFVLPHSSVGVGSPGGRRPVPRGAERGARRGRGLHEKEETRTHDSNSVVVSSGQ